MRFVANQVYVLYKYVLGLAAVAIAVLTTTILGVAVAADAEPSLDEFEVDHGTEREHGIGVMRTRPVGFHTVHEVRVIASKRPTPTEVSTDLDIRRDWEANAHADRHGHGCTVIGEIAVLIRC